MLSCSPSVVFPWLTSGLRLDFRPRLTLSDGAGGFLPGVPLGCCLGMSDGILSGPGPLPKLLGRRDRSPTWGWSLTHESNAGDGGAFPTAAPLGNWGGGYPLLQRICPVLHRGHDAWILY